MIKKGHWEKYEKLYLKNHYNGDNITEISKCLNRSVHGTMAQLHRLGILKSNRWSYEQEQYLIDNAQKKSDCEIAKYLGRTVEAIRQRRITLGLYIGNGAKKPWTEEEDARITKLIDSNLTYEKISELMGRSVCSITQRVRKLQIENSKMERDLKSNGIVSWLYRYGTNMTKKDALHKLKHTGLSQDKLENMYKNWRNEYMQTSNI